MAGSGLKIIQDSTVKRNGSFAKLWDTSTMMMDINNVLLW